MRAGSLPGVLLALLMALLWHSAEPVRAQFEPRLEGVEFRVTPPRLRWCGQPVTRIEAEVTWDVTATGAERVRILLDAPDGKLFHAGGATGRARTGEWVTDGLKFVLYLPELDRVAAEHTFRLLPCNTREYPG
ncbi:MAG: hypothetical protein RQ729_08130 [Wenzhouxiangellaceae bacterium]|nr:hypothetical protein [Wenzhouxiangellaceae bacterium]